MSKSAKEGKSHCAITETQPATKHKQKCPVGIITSQEPIRKFYYEKHLDFLSNVPQRQFQEIILSSCANGNNSKMADYGLVHRATYSYFLPKRRQNDVRLEEAKYHESFQTTRATGKEKMCQSEDKKQVVNRLSSSDHEALQPHIAFMRTEEQSVLAKCGRMEAMPIL